MGYVVVHARKVKTPAGLRNVAAHNSRTSVYGSNGAKLEPSPPWLIHPERAYFNKGDLHPPELTLKRWRDRIEKAELKRKPQKNAAAGIEFVVTASPGSLTKASDWQRYFEDTKKWLSSRYGVENVIQATTHFDEKTPHMHILMVPIIADRENGGNRYSSSDFLGGREGLRSLQTDLADEIGKKYGLERGSEGSLARHTDQHTYPSQARKERLALEAVVEKNGEILKEIVSEKTALMEIQKTFGKNASQQLGKMLYDVPPKRINECWKAFEAKADEIRKETHEAGRKGASAKKDDTKHGRGY